MYCYTLFCMRLKNVYETFYKACIKKKIESRARMHLNGANS